MLALATMAGNLPAVEWQVATNGNDANPGTAAAPFRTIQHAAGLAQPGDVITVHAGVYRERVSPPRGGTSDTQRIVYRAAPGEAVEISGAEVVTNWVKLPHGVWKVTLPNSFFGNFNPFNDVIHGDWYRDKGYPIHTGAVYLNGRWLVEARHLDEVLSGVTPLWATLLDNPVLLNVEWLRPAVANAPRIPGPAFAGKRGTQNAPCAEGGECVGWITSGDWLRYEKIDFGARAELLEIRAASATDGGVIEIHRDGPDGELLGSCAVPNTGGWQAWKTFTARIRPTGGAQTICLTFEGFDPAASAPGLWLAQVDAANTTIWAQFPAVDPNRARVEINARRTVFYPEKTGVNYITVRGFKLCRAAPPWAPPTAEQMGLIGPHWSKGWIIESNVICYSSCSGISLGKFGDAWDNRCESAEGYVATINRALSNGWNKAAVGSHWVRGNEISHCEQSGIVGSMGAAFSVIEGNAIHDIHVRQQFTGAEMAGIKFHGGIDVQVRRNHIYHCCGGLWLDWMGQGARVSQNLFHDNISYDLFFEVDHGPILVDNNIFLSPTVLESRSRGVAFAHNLFGGTVNINAYDGRQTPFLLPHATAVAGYRDNPRGDDRWYNNIFAASADLSQYDSAPAPVAMAGNVFLSGARPSKFEKEPVAKAGFDPALKLIRNDAQVWLEMRLDPAWTAAAPHQTVTTALLGRAAVPNAAFEQPDGSPVCLNLDYFNEHRNEANPTPGPFENPSHEVRRLEVWP